MTEQDWKWDQARDGEQDRELESEPDWEQEWYWEQVYKYMSVRRDNDKIEMRPSWRKNKIRLTQDWDQHDTVIMYCYHLN